MPGHPPRHVLSPIGLFIQALTMGPLNLGGCDKWYNSPMTLKEQLYRDEGCKDKAYLDSEGHWTIGVGHNLQVPLPPNIIDMILEYDIRAARRACESLAEYAGLSPARRAVVENMVFNLGLGGYLKFHKMRMALRLGDYRQAAKEMLDSKWAKQVGDRSTRLAEQMITDDWV